MLRAAQALCSRAIFCATTRSESMIIGLAVVRGCAGALLISAMLLLLGPTETSAARDNCTGSCITGLNACLAWCNSHNKTNRSQFICTGKCGDYWLSGKNPQSIGRGDPTKPPNKVGPGRLKNPPTTVAPSPKPPHAGPTPVQNAPTKEGNPDRSSPPELRSRHK
jgi:hypothetical protein